MSAKRQSGGAKVISLFGADAGKRSLKATGSTNGDPEPASARTVVAGTEGGNPVSSVEKSGSSPPGVDTLIGRTLQKGGYQIVRKIGEGGMGVVYEGLELSLKRKVALKRLSRDLASNPEAQERAHREANLLAKLNHPNIVRVERLIIEEAGEFMVMEYIEGKTLLEEIEERDGYLSFEDVARIARDLLYAIEYGHEENKPPVIHRDIKAENVMVNRRNTDGRIRWVKVLDYGVARVMDQGLPGGGRALTMEKSILGTPYYMSPEMSTGGKATVQSDVYASGVTIYYMLTRHLLFSDASDTVDGLLRAVAALPIPDIREKRPEIPEKLAAVVMRALAKKASDRWQSVSVFREAFEQAMLELLNDRERHLSMRPTSNPSINPELPGPSNLPKFDFSGETLDKRFAPVSPPGPRETAATKLEVKKPGLSREKVVVVGAAALLLPLALGVGYFFLPRKGRTIAAGPLTTESAVSLARAPASSSESDVRAAPSVASAAPTGGGPVSAPSQSGGSDLPAALEQAMKDCYRNPRGNRAACARFCGEGPAEHFFRRSACAFAGKPSQ